jgi:hypothetical protein
MRKYLLNNNAKLIRRRKNGQFCTSEVGSRHAAQLERVA